MKKLIKYIFGVISFGFVFATPAGAVDPMVFIQDLPEYMNVQDFKIHYTAVSDDGAVGPSAKFFVKKDGEAVFTEFASTTGYNGEAVVSGTQVNEQKKYFFRVEINGGAASDETSTIYDTSGPSPVSEYVKEKIAPGHYRLRWKNPGDSDFSRVFIYRSENSHFTADGSTKVGEHGGAPDSLQTWDNSGLDPNKTYYYAVRAVDKAGNPSGVVADPDTNVQVLGVAATATPGAEGVVTTLPKEGEVLADEDKMDEGQGEAMEGEGGEVSGASGESLWQRIKNLGAAKLGIIALLVLGFLALIYSYFKKEK